MIRMLATTLMAFRAVEQLEADRIEEARRILGNQVASSFGRTRSSASTNRSPDPPVTAPPTLRLALAASRAGSTACLSACSIHWRSPRICLSLSGHFGLQTISSCFPYGQTGCLHSTLPELNWPCKRLNWPTRQPIRPNRKLHDRGPWVAA